MQTVLQVPWWLIEVAIESKLRADQEKLGTALAELASEDRTFRVSTDTESGQIILGGLNEAHLDSKVDKLERTYKVEVNLGAPQVAYRETLVRRVARTEWHAENNPLQAVRVTMVFDPLPTERGNRFLHRADISSIPTNAIEAVGAAVARAMEAGVLAGFPVIGVQSTLIDAEWPANGAFDDGFERAAVAAARYALSQASTLLVPIMKVEVVTPDDYMGSVIGDLNSRRGLILGQDMRGDAKVVNALVPLASMFGYTDTLRSFSQGGATFTMQFDHYEPDVPPDDRWPPPAAAAALRA